MLFENKGMLFEIGVIAVIFGFVPLMKKIVLKEISIDTLIVISGVFYFVVTLLFLSSVDLAVVAKDVTTLNRGVALYVTLFIAMALIFVANYYYLSVIRVNKSYYATALVAVYPMVTALLGYLLMGEALTLKHLIGIVAIVFGVSMMSDTDFSGWGAA